MSLPNWFYPIVLLWLVTIPEAGLNSRTLSTRRSAWLMLVDTLFLLPWVLTLAFDEPLAAWVGVEIMVLVLLFDQLWRRPSQAFQEAWVKTCQSEFLSWLLIGTAVALSGVHPIVENLFYPLPALDEYKIRPVLAGTFFLLGICLKIGLPPFQQGVIDLMGVAEPEDHWRWALPMRWAVAFASWQLVPGITGPLSLSNQTLFATVLIAGCGIALLVTTVQASVQRTLSYLGTALVLPPLFSFLCIDPRLGMEGPEKLSIWILTITGFLCAGWVYQAWPRTRLADKQTLLWTDSSSPCSEPGWLFRLRLWMAWNVFMSLVLMVLAMGQQRWIIGLLFMLLSLAAMAAGTQQLGMSIWKEHNRRL